MTKGCFPTYLTVVIVVQSLSHVQLFVTTWTAACQASLSITNSQSYSNSCPLSWWCQPNISSSVVPFSSHRQSFPTSGKQYAIKRILLITFCQQIIKLGWNEQTVISKLLSVTHCVLMDTQSDWVRKTTYKDKGRPRRPIRVYLLIIQEADHFNFIHSLSDNINSKNGKMLQFLNVILIPKEENTRRKEDRGAFYSGIQMQKCSTKY